MHLPESSMRSLLFAAVSSLAVSTVADAASASRAEAPMHDVCASEGMRHAEALGASCVELGRRSVSDLGDGPVYWHISRLTRAERAAGVGADGWWVEAGDEAWAYAIGSRDAAPPFGEPIASIGPLPVRPEARYEVVTYFTTMPPGSSAAAHGHSGPEAWFLLSGAQCVETPGGTSRVGAGESMVARPKVPMRITSTGPGTRRALSIVLRDPEQPKALAQAWSPDGACHPSGGFGARRAPSVSLAEGERIVRRAVARVDVPSGATTSDAREPSVVAKGVEPDGSADRVGPARAAKPASAAKPAVEASANGSAHFSFAGLSLDSTIFEVRNRYPRSRAVGHYLYVAPEDSHDHVYGIEVADASPAGRVRLTFEHRPEGRGTSPAYPACSAIESTLERRYGRPTGVRNFYEESSRRSDRIWQQAGERLELLCFGAPDGLQAEAIVIYPASL